MHTLQHVRVRTHARMLESRVEIATDNNLFFDNLFNDLIIRMYLPWIFYTVMDMDMYSTHQHN